MKWGDDEIDQTKSWGKRRSVRKASDEWQLGTFFGIPILVSARIVLVPLLLLVFFRSVFDAAIGTIFMTVLVLIHELGHAWFARRRRLKILSIHLSALHGSCRYIAWQDRDTIIVAWGGVAAQALVFAMGIVIAQLFTVTPPIVTSSTFSWYHTFDMMAHVFGQLNIAMIVVNLLPITGLDGATAWRIIPIYDRWVSKQRRFR